MLILALSFITRILSPYKQLSVGPFKRPTKKSWLLQPLTLGFPSAEELTKTFKEFS